MSILWKKPIMDHLVWYKEHVIGCEGRGEYDHVKYGHIFPPDQTDLNFFDGKPPVRRWLKPASARPEQKIIRTMGFDHMNSAWVMGLNLFPRLFQSLEGEQALLMSLCAQGIPSLLGRRIQEAWFEEELGNEVVDLCFRLDDGKKLLLQLFYYNFQFGTDIAALFDAANESVHCVFVLLRHNTMLNPDYCLENRISEHRNCSNLHVIYWEDWIPCLNSLLSGDTREYCKEFYRKSLDF